MGNSFTSLLSNKKYDGVPQNEENIENTNTQLEMEIEIPKRNNDFSNAKIYMLDVELQLYKSISTHKGPCKHNFCESEITTYKEIIDSESFLETTGIDIHNIDLNNKHKKIIHIKLGDWCKFYEYFNIKSLVRGKTFECKLDPECIILNMNKHDGFIKVRSAKIIRREL